ncbi:MAG: tetratricopeptide repeat protein, partial [Candidatus Saccharimonadales bacterium]
DPNNLFALLVRAQSLALADKAEEALPEAEQALRFHPDNDNAVQVWAMVIEKCGKTKQTIRELAARAENDLNDAGVWTQLALLYSAQRRLGKAIEAFTAAIKADNTRPFLYRMRADAYLSVGEQKAALADYEAAMQLEPGDTGVLNNLAWLLATSPEENLRDGRRAIELATKAGELTHHQQAHILSTIAAAYAEAGDFDNARRWSEKAVELGDENLKEQLRKELASYEDEKPWREKQGEPAEPPSGDSAP